MPIHLALTEQYRPRTFEDVVGQEKIVAEFRRRVIAGDLGPVLGAGPSGTGKTSLMRILSNALQCEAPTPTQSPCGKCPPCLSFATGYPQMYHYEFSAATHREFAKGKIAAELSQVFMTVRYGVFVDEIHGFDNAAADALLEATERPSRGAYYMFATTELEKVRPALRARCSIWDFKLLRDADCMKLLTQICLREGFLYDPDALETLVFESRGSAREAVKLLELVSRQGRITANLVASALAHGWIGCVIHYMEALLEGNLSAQEDALAEWNVLPSRKAKGIRDFLLYLYNFEIARPALNRLVDGAFRAVTPKQREYFVSRFRPRAGQMSRTLDSYWHEIMSFWNFDHDGVADAENLSVRIIRFNKIVNAGFDEPPSPIGTRVIAPRDKRYHVRTLILPTGKLMLAANPMSFRQAETIYDAASFVSQEYGVLFNARFRIVHEGVGAERQTTAKALISQFTHELSIFSQRCDPTKKPHWLYVHEQVEGVLATEVLAYLPAITVERLEPWLNGRREDWCGLQSLSGGTWTIDVQPPGGAKSHVARHWRMVKRLWRTLDQGRGRKGPDGIRTSLVELLGVPMKDWARSDDMNGLRRIQTSYSIGADKRRKSENMGMNLLSAWADGAWSYIDSGWEQLEFIARIDEISTRENYEDLVKAKWPESDNSIERTRREEELSRLYASWPSDPKDRRRDWEGWWG